MHITQKIKGEINTNEHCQNGCKAAEYMIDYTLTIDNLHLFDSYRVPRWKMRGVLEDIKKNGRCLHQKYPASFSQVFKRSFFSLKMEWLCHNTLYWLGIQRDLTKDADLDYPCDRSEWQYIACGIGVTVLELAVLAGIVWALISII